MRLLAVLAAVAAMVFGGARDADACACVVPDRTPEQERQHVEEQLGRAVAVFAGTVARVDRVTARLDVETIWKGDLDEQVVMPLHDGPQPDGTLAFSSCDYVFRAGRRYLVFAYSDPQGRMRAYSCTYTAELTNAARTVALLDGIVTPRRTGRQVLRLRGLRQNDVRVGRPACTSVPALDMLVAVGGNGKAQFALQSQHLLDRSPDARLLVCAGTAGSLTPSVAVGDVVVSTVIVEHDFLERFVSVALRRHEADARGPAPKTLHSRYQSPDATRLTR